MSRGAKLIHSLPGRIRLAVPAIGCNPDAADTLRERLLGVEGIYTVKTGLHTGTVLVLFDVDIIDQYTITSLVSEPLANVIPGHRSKSPDPISPATAATALAISVARQLIPIPPPDEAGMVLPTASATLGIMTGYPSIRDRLRRTFGGRVDVDTLLTVGSFVCLACRGSILGLTVLTIYGAVRKTEETIRVRARSLMAQRSSLNFEDTVENTPELVSELSPLAKRLANLSWLVAWTMLLTGRGMMTAITALVAGSPKNLSSSDALIRANAISALADGGIVIAKPDALQKLTKCRVIAIHPGLLEKRGAAYTKLFVKTADGMGVSIIDPTSNNYDSRIPRDNTVLVVYGDEIEDKNDSFRSFTSHFTNRVSLSLDRTARDDVDGLIIGDDLMRLFFLLKTIRQMSIISRENELICVAPGAWGLCYVALGYLGLPMCLFCADLSAVAVIVNSRRLRFMTPKQPLQLESGLAPVASAMEPELVLHSPKCPEWHTLGRNALSEFLCTDFYQGLSGVEAQRRLSTYGLNQLVQTKRLTFGKLFLKQFENAMVLALLGASAVTALAGGLKDALTILGTLTVNGLFGAYQEFSTDSSILELKRLVAPSAKVYRDGKLIVIPSVQLVPGDIIELSAGDRIPADCRLLDVYGIQTEESSITGESMPVIKTHDEIESVNIPLGDRTNMLFMGTGVTRGRAKAVVVNTGMSSEMGSIMSMIEDGGGRPSPLQRSMDAVGQTMLGASLAVAGTVIVLGLLRGNPLMTMFITGVSVAVAAIPEGLPITVTLALTAGVRRMARERAIARRLSAIETLGAVTVICTDKTGTLTTNKMEVRSVYAGDSLWEYVPKVDAWRPIASLAPSKSNPGIWPSRVTLTLLAAAAACCDGADRQNQQEKSYVELRDRVDPIDSALKDAYDAAIARAGLAGPDSLEGYECVAEVPFDSDRKRVTVVVRSPHGRTYAVTKGAVDSVLPLCSSYRGIDGQRRSINTELDAIDAASKSMMARSLRIIGVAIKEIATWENGTLEPLEEDMEYLGTIGMADPPRSEIADSLELCKHAGVKVVMATGDHPSTALALASELGIASSTEAVLTGAQLDAMTEQELISCIESISIFARVSPRHKLRIMKVLQSLGHTVAMTGDGVNDAPAIKEADVGIAMGSGTETTKEASDLIVTDDSFSSIVKAVREGRGIRHNIRNAIGYNMGGNTGEVIAMLLGIAAGMPLPLLPIQLLLLNLLSDGLPVFALATAKPDNEVMNGKPTEASESLFARGLTRQMVIRGLAIGGTAFALYGWALRGGNIARARSIALASLVVSQWAQVPDWEFGGEQHSREGRKHDSRLMATVGLSALAFPLVFHLPIFSNLFGTVPLSIADWGIIGATSLGASSISKAVQRHQEAGA